MNEQTGHRIGPYLVFAPTRKEAIERLRKYLDIKEGDDADTSKKQDENDPSLKGSPGGPGPPWKETQGKTQGGDR